MPFFCCLISIIGCFYLAQVSGIKTASSRAASYKMQTFYRLKQSGETINRPAQTAEDVLER